MDFGEAPIARILAGSLAMSPALVGLDSKPKIAGIFLGLSFSGVCAWFVWKIFVYPHFFSPFRDLPSPPGASKWNGHHEVLSTGQHHVRVMRDWVLNVPNDGMIRFMNALNQERILVTSPEVLHEIQVTRNYDFEKPEVVRYSLGRILGDGLIVSEGHNHKVQRRALAPGFTTKQIRLLYPKFWAKGRESAIAIAKEADAPVDIGDWASRITLDIVGSASLGRDFGSVQDPKNPLTMTYKRVFAPESSRDLLNLATMFLPRWMISYLPLESNRILMESASHIRQFSRELIQSKRESLAKGNAPATDVLEVLLSSSLSEEQLVDQVMTFLAAGHETSAASLTWTVYLLAKHQDIQRKLRKEIRDSMPSFNPEEEATSEVFENMTYLQAFVSEALRYYPGVPHVLRESVVDTSIQGRHIPKGTRFIVSPGAINFSSKVWGPDAGEFKPERWLEDTENGTALNGGASSKYGFMTFLQGHRGCIGQGFTRGEMACILTAWVGKLQFDLHNEADAEDTSIRLKRGGVTFHPAAGPMIKVTVLDDW